MDRRPHSHDRDRWAEGRTERYPEIAAEFVRLKVDVIVTAGGAVPALIAGDIGHPDRFRDRRRTRSGEVSSRDWRGRAATSPAFRLRADLAGKQLELLREVLPEFAGWRSWPTPPIPAPCRRRLKFRQRPARSASKS